MSFKLLALFVVSCLVLNIEAAGPEELKTCFDGYTLNSNGLCIQEIDDAPQPACPSGHIDGRGCRVQVPKIKKCEEGFTLDQNGNCSYPTTTEQRYYCPKGFADAGDNCMQSLPGPVKDYCVDSDRVGDRCVRVQKADALVAVTCPEGATLEDGHCWRSVETFDCTGEFDCIKKCSEPACIKASHLRRLTGEEKLVPVSAPRPYKITIVSQICQKKFEVPTIIEQTCPDGFLDDGESCFLEEYLPLHSECIETGGPIVGCPLVINFAPKVAMCSDGTPAVDGMCTELVLGHGLEYCPNGFTEVGSVCESYVEAPLECPADLLYKNGRCIGRRTHPAVVVKVEDEIEVPVLTKPLVAATHELRTTHHLNIKNKVKE